MHKKSAHRSDVMCALIFCSETSSQSAFVELRCYLEWISLTTNGGVNYVWWEGVSHLQH